MNRMPRPSDATKTLPLMVEPSGSSLIPPPILANIVPRVDHLRHLMMKAIDVVEAHQAYLNFNPREMASLASVESEVYRRARNMQKRKVDDDEVVSELLVRGWGKPGTSKKNIKFEVSQALGISESSVQDAARRGGLTKRERQTAG